jgi:deazaflavin-dependent oxidoreductase (nitroreductase family)
MGLSPLRKQRALSYGHFMSSNLRRAYAVGPGRRMINRIYAALARLGLGASHLQLLTVTGRRSGIPRTTPVDVMNLDGTSYLVAPYGVVSWVHNVRAAGHVELSRRGQTRRYLATELDPADAAPVIRLYITSVPVTRAWWSVRGDASDTELQAEAATHPVFCLTQKRDQNSPISAPRTRRRGGA